MESKRKRIGPVTEAQHYDISMDEGCSSKDDPSPKNELLAGPVAQARQSP